MKSGREAAGGGIYYRRQTEATSMRTCTAASPAATATAALAAWATAVGPDRAAGVGASGARWATAVGLGLRGATASTATTMKGA